MDASSPSTLEIDEPVIDLPRKVLSLLTGGVIK
jgi:hypothetical protein